MKVVAPACAGIHTRGVAHIDEGRVAAQANPQPLCVDFDVQHLRLYAGRHLDEDMYFLERLLPLVYFASLMLVRQPFCRNLVHRHFCTTAL